MEDKMKKEKKKSTKNKADDKKIKNDKKNKKKTKINEPVKQMKVMPKDVLPLIKMFIERIEKTGDGVHTEAIYRACGSQTQVNILDEALKNIEELQRVLDKENNVHVMTVALKQWLRNLDEPFLDFKKWKKAMNKSGDYSEARKLKDGFPKIKSEAFKILMTHLHKISQEHDVNHMNAHALAVIFGPTLMPYPISLGSVNEATKTALVDRNEVVEFLLQHFTTIFEDEQIFIMEKKGDAADIKNITDTSKRGELIDDKDEKNKQTNQVTHLNIKEIEAEKSHDVLSEKTAEKSTYIKESEAEKPTDFKESEAEMSNNVLSSDMKEKTAEKPTDFKESEAEMSNNVLSSDMKEKTAEKPTDFKESEAEMSNDVLSSDMKEKTAEKPADFKKSEAEMSNDVLSSDMKEKTAEKPTDFKESEAEMSNNVLSSDVKEKTAEKPTGFKESEADMSNDVLSSDMKEKTAEKPTDIKESEAEMSNEVLSSDMKNQASYQHNKEKVERDDDKLKESTNNSSSDTIKDVGEEQNNASSLNGSNCHVAKPSGSHSSVQEVNTDKSSLESDTSEDNLKVTEEKQETNSEEITANSVDNSGVNSSSETTTSTQQQGLNELSTSSDNEDNYSTDL